MTKLRNEKKIGIVNVRRAFLDFLQSIFYEDSVYTWRSDPNSRKIEIVNEFASKQLEIEKYPRIVLTRGFLGTRNVSLNLRGHTETLFQPDTKHIQDLGTGNLHFSVLSKSAIEAEQIAEKVFFSILAWRDELRASGYIFKINSVSIGSLAVVSQNSDFRVFEIPVNIAYDKEFNFYKTYDYYDVELTVSGLRKYQSTDFWIYGNLVYFNSAPASGVTISMDYYDRTTLSGVTEAPLLGANGVRTVFPFSYDIYGPYYIVSGLSVEFDSISGIDTFFNYYTLYDNIEITQEAGPRVHRQGHSYLLPGLIYPDVGTSNYIPPFFISNAPGQVTKLVSASYKVQSGGDVYCHILRNGNVISSYSGLLVNSGLASLDATDVYLESGDSISLKVAKITGSPENLSFTIFLDYIQ